MLLPKIFCSKMYEGFAVYKATGFKANHAAFIYSTVA